MAIPINMPPLRYELLQRLCELPLNAVMYKVDSRRADNLCRDGYAECVGDIERYPAYKATYEGRKLINETK